MGPYCCFYKFIKPCLIFIKILAILRCSKVCLSYFSFLTDNYQTGFFLLWKWLSIFFVWVHKELIVGELFRKLCVEIPLKCFSLKTNCGQHQVRLTFFGKDNLFKDIGNFK